MNTAGNPLCHSMLRSQVGDYDPDTGKFRVRQKRSATPTRPATSSDADCDSSLREAGARQEARRSVVFKDQGWGFAGPRYWFDPCVKQAGLVNLTWKSATRHGCKPSGQGWCADHCSDEVFGPRIHCDDDAIRTSTTRKQRSRGGRNDVLLPCRNQKSMWRQIWHQRSGRISTER
jgi:hypothetical protein